MHGKAGLLEAVFRFFVNNLMSLARKKNFIRLTPNFRGKIYFYNRKNRKIFHVQSRSRIDSLVADQIYTRMNYGIDFLRRKKELGKFYESVSLNGKIPLIIDCGANIGLSTRYFAEEYPLAKVIGIEPSVLNCELAKENCAHLENVEIVEKAVGATSNFVKIINTNSNSWGFRTSSSDSKDDIPVVSLNQLLEEFPGHELFIVKMDIEGYEADVFSKDTSWVSKSMLIIIELHDWMLPKQANSQKFLKVISNENRDFVFNSENVFSIRNPG